MVVPVSRDNHGSAELALLRDAGVVCVRSACAIGELPFAVKAEFRIAVKKVIFPMPDRHIIFPVKNFA